MFIELIITASAALVLGIGASAFRAFFSRRVRVARTLAAGRPVAIADFPEGGSATVRGTVSRFEGSTDAPFSGEPCVYYRLLVEGPEQVGKATRVFLERAGGVDFYVEDGSGRALVSVAEADSTLTKRTVPYRTVVAQGGDRMLSDVDTEGFGHEELRYLEGRLTEGQGVVIHGVGRWEASPGGAQGADYRSPPKRLRLAAPLTIADSHHQGDGER